MPLLGGPTALVPVLPLDVTGTTDTKLKERSIYATISHVPEVFEAPVLQDRQEDPQT